MRGRGEMAAVLGGVLALGCVDDVPARFQESKHALTLLHTSDIHSRVWPFRSRISMFEASLGLGPADTLQEVGGLARLGSLLGQERARGVEVWLDSGDALEGAGVFGRYGGRVELELLSALGLSAMALGNHELSLPSAELSQLLRGSAQFPLLSANVRPRPGSSLSRVLPATTLLTAAGLKLGIVGVANPESPPNLAAFDNPWGLSSVAPAAAVQLAVDELGAQAGVVVVLSHLGLERDRALVAATSGVDLVLGGHQHLVTNEPEWQDDCGPELRAQRGCRPRVVPIVHSGAYGKFLSRLELELQSDPAAPGTFEVAGLELEQLPLGAAVVADGRVAQQLEQYRAAPSAPLAFLHEPLWRRSALGGDSALGNLVTDAVREASGVDVALLNTSGLRADLEAGLVLRSDLELALPFDEPWLVAWLSGRQLRLGLERAAWRTAARDCESSVQLSGLSMQVDCAACARRSPDCLRVARLTPFGEQPLTEEQLLLVALPVYVTLENGDFAAAAVAVVRTLETTVSDLVAGHFTRFPGLAANAVRGCEVAAFELSGERCREAFGSFCPVSEPSARALCAELPAARGGRDERIRTQL
jgi:5'-nucleotidase/UDP-sugar diphosphatase